MPGLWRTRVASFFAGSGLTALLAFGILRQDLQRQFGTLGEQVRSWGRAIDADCQCSVSYHGARCEQTCRSRLLRMANA